MVHTMSSMVRRSRFPMASAAFVVSGVAGASAAGLTLAAAAWLLFPPPWLIGLAALAAMGAMRDAFFLRVPISIRRVQVDDMVRVEWPWWVFVPAYASTLGFGALTAIPFAGFLTLVAIGLLVGGPLTVIAFASYGLGRSLLVVVLATVGLVIRPRRVVRAMLDLHPFARAVSVTSQLILASIALASSVNAVAFSVGGHL